MNSYNVTFGPDPESTASAELCGPIGYGDAPTGSHEAGAAATALASYRVPD